MPQWLHGLRWRLREPDGMGRTLEAPVRLVRPRHDFDLRKPPLVGQPGKTRAGDVVPIAPAGASDDEMPELMRLHLATPTVKFFEWPTEEEYAKRPVRATPRAGAPFARCAAQPAPSRSRRQRAMEPLRR